MADLNSRRPYSLHPKTHRSNPFATRFVAPGRLAWIGNDRETLASLRKRFDKMGRRAQIVGPHGTGKSTLLAHLAPQLGPLIKYESCVPGYDSSASTRFPLELPAAPASASSDSQEPSPPASVSSDSQAPSPPALRGRGQGEGVYWFVLRRVHPVMRSTRRQLWKLGRGDLLILDGFEQFSPIERVLITWWTYWRGCGLLVTSHRQVGLPVLLRTEITSELAHHAVQQCWRNVRGSEPLPDYLEQFDCESLLKRHDGNLREGLMELYDWIETHEQLGPSKESQ